MSAAREARRVEPAHHRAHAGAGDGVHGNVVFLEHLEHADVGRAARTAAGQHQPDARALAGRLRPARAAKRRAPRQITANNADFLALLIIVGVARIVFRRDNRPPNHAQTLTLVALLPLAASAATTCRAASRNWIRPAGGHRRHRARATARRPFDDTGQRLAHRRRHLADRRLQTSGRRAQSRRRRLHPARQRRGEPRAPFARRCSTGAGACGAFLVAEDSLPIRPVGFCNLNEMFELNYEQAESDRGAARSGLVDVWRQRRPRHRQRAHAATSTASTGIAAGLEGGSDSFKRVRSRRLARARTPGIWRLRQRHARAGLARRVGCRRGQAQSTRANGIRAAARCGCAPPAPCSTRKPRASSRDSTAIATRPLARINPNPGGISRRLERARLRAFRATTTCFADDWHACELAAHLSPLAHGFPAALPRSASRSNTTRRRASCVSGTARDSLLERSRRCASRSTPRRADSELTEFQPGPATDGAPAANAIRPAGFHYDYTRRLRTPSAPHWRSSTAIARRHGRRRGAARRPHYLRLRQPHDRRQHARGWHALRSGGCLYLAARGSQRRLRQRLAAASRWPGRPATLDALRQRVDGFPPAGDDRALPAAAPADGGRSRQRKARFRRARLEMPPRRSAR